MIFLTIFLKSKTNTTKIKIKNNILVKKIVFFLQKSPNNGPLMPFAT
jgi:hypothetical protein